MPNLLPRDGEAYLVEQALTPNEADHAFTALMGGIDWRQEQATLFGRGIPLPRLTAWYGAHGYGYSGIHHKPAPLPSELAPLQSAAEAIAGIAFNCVLINLYRDGGDSMGWHSDDEAALGSSPTIASLSLGAIRRFRFRHRQRKEHIAIDLEHGSCLIMRGRCQASWQHQLPKTKKQIGPRINLTFRTILI